jgi:hypothetical protein
LLLALADGLLGFGSRTLKLRTLVLDRPQLAFQLRPAGGLLGAASFAVQTEPSALIAQFVALCGKFRAPAVQGSLVGRQLLLVLTDGLFVILPPSVKVIALPLKLANPSAGQSQFAEKPPGPTPLLAADLPHSVRELGGVGQKAVVIAPRELCRRSELSRVKHFEFDGAKAEPVAAGQGRVIKTSAIEPRVGTPAADHCPARSAQNEAVQRLNPARHQSQGTVGPGPDRAFGRFQADNLAAASRSRNPENQFPVFHVLRVPCPGADHDRLPARFGVWA